MARKFPPPPVLAGPEWQIFNRWLLEIQSILSNEGGIDPNEVTGLPALFTAVGVNTNAIAALGGTVAGQGGDIAGLQGDITTINGEIVAINGQITTLSARAQVLNGIIDPAPGLGNVNDWYANTVGAVGHRIFVKTGVATWTAFPF